MRHNAELVVDALEPGDMSSDRLFGAKVEVAANESSSARRSKVGLAAADPLVIEAVVDPAEYDAIL